MRSLEASRTVADIEPGTSPAGRRQLLSTLIVSVINYRTVDAWRRASIRFQQLRASVSDDAVE